MTYQLNGENLPVDIIRKNNKNTYLRVKDGHIIVTTNHITTKKQIKEMLDSNIETLKKMLNQELKRRVKEQDHHLYLWGQAYDVIYGFDDTTIENNKIYTKDEKNLNKFIQKYIFNHFQERLILWYNQFEESIPPPSLRIRKMKTRWGVCNTKTKVITLNSELLSYEPICLDYVIIHELSHLIHPNHSKDFWNVVFKYCPNYKNIRKKLRD